MKSAAATVMGPPRRAERRATAAPSTRCWVEASAVPSEMYPSLGSHAANLPGPAAPLGPSQDKRFQSGFDGGFWGTAKDVTLQNFFQILLIKIFIELNVVISFFKILSYFYN
jgi:hypothetical protein